MKKKLRLDRNRDHAQATKLPHVKHLLTCTNKYNNTSNAKLVDAKEQHQRTQQKVGISCFLSRLSAAANNV